MTNTDWIPKLRKLGDIDAAEVANCSWVAKSLLLLTVFALCIGLGRMLLLQERAASHQRAVQNEQSLLQGLRLKLTELRDLPALQSELRQLQQRYAQQRRAFPNEMDVSGLLRDITEARLLSGLQGDLFKPGELQSNPLEQQLQVELKLTGSYPQLLRFVEQLSQLPRFVALSGSSIRHSSSGGLVMATLLTAYAIPLDQVVASNE